MRKFIFYFFALILFSSFAFSLPEPPSVPHMQMGNLSGQTNSGSVDNIIRNDNLSKSLLDSGFSLSWFWWVLIAVIVVFIILVVIKKHLLIRKYTGGSDEIKK